MKYFLSIFAVIFINAAIVLGDLSPKPFYQYELVKLLERRATFAYPVDVEGDGTDEIVFIDDGGWEGDISILTQQESYVSQHRFNKGTDFYFTRASTLIRSFKNNVVITCRYGDSVFALPLHGDRRWQRKVFLQFRPLVQGHNHPYWSGYFLPIGFYDVDGDGSDDLLGTWCTGVPSFPRGIAAYNLINGRELWYHKTGAAIFDFACILKDVNGDDTPEILYGTSSTANGASFNGTDDMTAYAVALDVKGRMLWQRAVPKVFCNICVFDAQSPGRTDRIFCMQQSQGKYTGVPDTIMLLNANDGAKLKSVPCGKTARGSLAEDMYNNGEVNLVTGNSDGRVRVYSPDLDLLYEYLHSEDVPVSVLGVDDYDGDGNKEIVAIAQDKTLFVLNNRCQLVFSDTQPFCGEQGFFLNVRQGSARHFLTITGSASGNNLIQMWKLARKPFYYQKNIMKTIHAVGIPALLALLFFIYMGMGNRTRRMEKVLVDLNGVGIIFTDRKGRITFYNPCAKELLFPVYGEGVTREKFITDVLPEIKQNFEGNINIKRDGEKSLKVNCIKTDFGMTALITDETWHDYCRRVASWAPVAQEMAHGIKTPLTTIVLAAQKIASVCNGIPDMRHIHKYSRSIEDEAKRLQQVADGFMRIVQIEEPVKVTTDAAQLVGGLVKEKRALLASGVSMELNASSGLPLISVDPQQMKSALGNVVDNAIAAVGNGGRINIDIRQTEMMTSSGAVDTMEIAIIDNGCGIKDTYKKQLFTPFASFRPGGTGLGLVLAKKIVESHGGAIQIDSKEDHGTTVTITLPVQ